MSLNFSTLLSGASARSALCFVAGVLCVAFAAGAEARACSCGDSGPPCQAFWQADAVFTGTVVGEGKVTPAGDHYERRLVRFSVQEPLRGVRGARAEVVTGLGGGDCGFRFKSGETYLVYAYRNQGDARLSTGICTRTRLLSEGAEDLAYFRSLASAEAGAVVQGTVGRRNHEPAPGSEWYKPVAGASLVVEGAGGRAEARTDARGRFGVAGLAPGEYTVRLFVPEGLDEHRAEGGVVTQQAKAAARGCAELFFLLEADTRVAGRVTDSEGQPVAELPLQLRGKPAGPRQNAPLHARTDDDGRFEFRQVPAGDYLLGFRILEHPAEDSHPFLRMYYPGVETEEQALVVSVKEGERLGDLEMRLPEHYAGRVAEVLVTWADGRPAPKAKVYLLLSREGSRPDGANVPRTFEADEQGRVSLKIYEGLAYKLSAFLRDADGASSQSTWIDLPQTAEGPLKLVLPPTKK